jgi:hypothetical protein
MHVIHQLAGGPAIVIENIVTFCLDGGYDGFGDLAQPGGHRRHDRRGALVKGRAVGLGDDQAVAFGPGVDVQKSQDFIILIDLVAGNLAGRNPAENAIGGHF